MDKYDLVIDIVTNPDKYTARRLRELLSDPETHQIYNLLCKTQSAVEAQKKIDTDVEWRTFSTSVSKSAQRRYHRLSGRAASITALLVTSLVVVAVSVAVKVSIADRDAEKENLQQPAAVTNNTAAADITYAPVDTVDATKPAVLFDDATLYDIMKSVDEIYGVTTRFDDRETARIRMYYRLDPALTLEETVERLNTFDQINIRIAGKTLIVD